MQGSESGGCYHRNLGDAAEPGDPPGTRRNQPQEDDASPDDDQGQ